MELMCIAPAVEGDVQVCIQTRGPMQGTNLGENFHVDKELLGRNLHVHSDVQNKEVLHVSIPNAATVDNTKDIDNVVKSTRLGNSIQTDW